MSHNTQKPFLDTVGVAGISEVVSPSRSTLSAPTWCFDTGSPVTAAPTVGTDGVVYAANEDGRISAFYDGQLRWRYHADGTVTEDLVFRNDLYVVSDDRVFALDSETGERRWETALDSSTTTSPTIVGETAYIGTETGLVALDSASGDERWRFHGPACSTVVASELRAYAAGDGRVWALDGESGHLEWSFDPGRGVESLAFETGRLYVGSGTESACAGYNLHALGMDGSVLWQTRTRGDEAVVSLTVTNASLYAVCDTRYGHPETRGQRLRKLSPWDGTMEWVFQPDAFTAETESLLTQPTAVVGTVYVGASDGRVYLLDSTHGTERSRFETMAAVRTRPAASHERVYTGSDDGSLYAFEPQR
ncbi:Outer membrane protein assembly factor BamB, contains PQQ-like beta-propeller repeat [Haladaptatus litoreus]|uniref:Outer membrane protein assembly factor BamB, contains PQQ-like beta-propeller repeat n=1 Tax=Haladaptatus litoreus TaxID=553468 RepID=A0A1N6ZHT6_9EURY|nr:PQQ-binding-like beta-propeller repeat protein [Haladaptatus litoreus]SIR26347.1 Outer membrane protein assembly factor BamB, contains PQQ-like beta-propeller repeat [Haladaptatus litoreus]